ncbi:hypothetical protein P691DRAFT_790135 [Macrolepiota fuliginosa MF-IS2]|uniref:Uncharacterized protein n=1 Tax=Macrolepiota fuliginosa MF-IS2 TaxID=1400762 RepID=A0A9P6BY16_9AGAR|nr:hypothetical protein P691DRAFT_790135 [Macrolepiota fuliginosa MF-IS2]
MCNLLGISRTKFYAAMRRLHSVINIPEPSDATYTPPHFFHAAFLDYLTNPNRAGRFFIGRIVTDYRITIAAGLRDFVLSGLRCLGSTIGLAEINQNRLEVRGNPEISLLLKQELSWASGDAYTNWANAEVTTWAFSTYFFELICMLLKYSELDDQVLAFLHVGYRMYSPPKYLNKLWTSSLIRTQSISEWDQILLSKVAVRYPNMNPFDFDDAREDGYFLLGDGTNSIAVVVIEVKGERSIFQFVSHKTPPRAWPIPQHISISWD